MECMFPPYIFWSCGVALSLTSIEPPAVAETRPSRIVSMSLASDEILLELLPHCGGLDRLTAVSTFADDSTSSHATQTAKAVKARVHSEPEGVLGLKPDLVIAASFNRSSLLELLAKKKIPLRILSRFSSHKDIVANIETIGEATGCRKAAADIASTFQRKIDAIVASTKQLPLESAVSYSHDFTVMARNTLFDDLLTINNLSNAASTAGLQHWPKVSPEALLKWDPDWIVISCDGSDCGKIKSDVAKHAVWKKLRATKAEKFILVSPKDALSTSHYFGVKLRN